MHNIFKKRTAGDESIMETAANQPFDLAKIQHEMSYRANRRLWLKRASWSALGMLLIAWWFLQPGLLTGRAIGNYKHDHNVQARDWLAPVTWTSPQRYIVAFNSGTVDTKLGHYDLAQKELFTALALAPASRRCMVVQNLVYSLGAHASSLKAAHNSSDATVYSTQATSYISTNPQCFRSAGAKHKGIGGGGGGGGGSTADQQQQSNSPSPSADQQQQLQQKEQEGEQRQQQYINEDNFNPDNPHLKQW